MLSCIKRSGWGPWDSPELVFGQVDAWRQILKLKTPLGVFKPPRRRTALLSPLAKTPKVINNESFTTFTAITCRNLYITTKGLVPLHQGICGSHAGQLPSSCNCCISMQSCKTTRILTVGLGVGNFYCFYTKTSHVTSIQLPASGFCQRGRKKHKSVLCAHFRHSQKCIFGWICGGRKREAWLEVKLLLRISGPWTPSQGTHGEQAE